MFDRTDVLWREGPTPEPAAKPARDDAPTDDLACQDTGRPGAPGHPPRRAERAAGLYTGHARREDRPRPERAGHRREYDAREAQPRDRRTRTDRDRDTIAIDCAAYTLRVGSEVFISPSTAVEAARKTKLLLKEDEGFAIPPGQFALVLTEESVEVPKSAVAFISMKARIKFKGLVNVSGFHVDPGYHGKLLFAIYNANASPVHLARGDDAFLICYASLDVESETYSRRASSFSGLPSELITPISGPSILPIRPRLDLGAESQGSHRSKTTCATASFVCITHPNRYARGADGDSGQGTILHCRARVAATRSTRIPMAHTQVCEHRGRP